MKTHGRIVVLGMMTKMPVAGVVWQTVHYLEGLRRLGYDVYYVEAHARTPSMFAGNGDGDGTERAVAFVDRTMRRFGLDGHWAVQALHGDGRCHGLDESRLAELYRSAALIINLHGGTRPLPEHAAAGRLIYLETDPVQLQIELFHGAEETRAFLEPHIAFFTFGENYGRPGCLLPRTDRFEFRPTRQPVVMDFWSGTIPAGDRLTTIGNWKQAWRDIRYGADTYTWSKDREFGKVLELPGRTPQPLELSLSSLPDEDRDRLEEHGWLVRDALDISGDLDAYRGYIRASRGEFTVAKDQNIRFRSGWFSDRSATYLAAGRPVITQDTGFDCALPVGAGLFAFADLDGALAAVEAVRSDPDGHGRAAREIARACFDHRVVLGELLATLGLPAGPRARGGRPAADGPGAGTPAAVEGLPFPRDLVLEPVSRHPTTLRPATLREAARQRPIRAEPEAAPTASVVVVTYNGLAFTRLCLETLLAHTGPHVELVVVDNGSTDGTPAYLAQLADGYRRVRVLAQNANLGFAAANNLGLRECAGRILVLLNNDTIVPSRWLQGLVRHLENPEVGAVGPVTNRICNEARIPTTYATYGELMDFAAERARRLQGESFDIPTLAMFCFAMRRSVYEVVGPLDESFGLGTLEDDDYSLRIRRAGLRTVCAEDVVVHHFDKASFGVLVPDGRYQRLLEENRRRFEEKWGLEWQPYEQRTAPEYGALVQRFQSLVRSTIPEDATVAVISRGDDRLLELDGRPGRHFPSGDGGAYAGCYPASGQAAIVAVETLRAEGGRFLAVPRPGLWWLDHYAELRDHLESRYSRVADQPDTAVIFDLTGSAP